MTSAGTPPLAPRPRGPRPQPDPGRVSWQSAAAERPHLVATDLDGTLLRSDGTVSRRTVRALEGVAASGVGTVVVTARPPRWLHGLQEVVGEHGIALCANGAFVYRVAEQEILAARTIDRGVLAEVAADLRRAIPGTGFAAERATGLAVEAAFSSRHPFPEDVVDCDRIESDAGDPVGKLLARCPGMDDEEFLERVVDVVGDRLVMAVSGPGGLAEMSAPGVTKAAVLAEWAGRLQVEATSVWAFGDAPNDLPMLEWAGVSFAVANAHPQVLRTATHTCPANDEDGVAQVLETLLLD